MTVCENTNNKKVPVCIKFLPKGAKVQLSFQLMTCAEPPELVITSIKSLLAIKAPADEILIIDNNNRATELYEPLAAFCNSLDVKLRVRFYHVDTVSGFKAGALNLALELMDAQSTHIVVVDSDYQALPQARIAIKRAIEQYPECSLLQFPQFYRDSNRVEVHGELNHYFNYHLYRAFNRQRALSTGTYAVIRCDALLSLGGWSGASITEDAQMGVLMHKQGLRSRFIPEVIATGLLPTTVSDLMNQRRRWIYGNAQVIKGYSVIFSKPMLSPSSLSISEDVGNWKSNKAQKWAYMRAHLSQLSAWMNATGIFILLQVITLLVILSALLIKANLNPSLLLAPLYLVYAGYGLYLIRRLWAYCHDASPLNEQMSLVVEQTSIRARLKVWALHLNFWELGALSWLPVLWGRDKPFVCTPKLMTAQSSRTLWLKNVLALPKLLLVLNITTAIIVAPFSPLYSPLLFICALSVCLLKIVSATIILSNYTYKNVTTRPNLNSESLSTEPFIDKSLVASQYPIDEKQDAAIVIKKPICQQALMTSKLDDKKIVNS